MTTHNEALYQRVVCLKLHGLIAYWDEIEASEIPQIERWIQWEEQERSQRGMQRRLRAARLGRFKPLADFEWKWPKKIDQNAVSDLMSLEFIKTGANAIFIGPNGVGKSTITQNIAHQAIIHGHSVLFTTAAQMLNELAAIDSDSALRRRLKHYAQPDLLVIDEVGYLSYGNRHADLLFEIINSRYEKRATMITTNRPFSQWNDLFPNAACVVSMIDRLIHHAEIIDIQGESYRKKEANERAAKKRKSKRTKKEPS